ncbi:MAG TPA: ribonuclease HII [Herpetosiphonaceae bacterium]
MPTIDEEQTLQAQGYRSIAGIDEAGRGCWAGPVVAAAVVLGEAVLAQPTLLAGVDDSKQLSAIQRATLEGVICQHAAGIGVGIVPAHLIDWFGIVEATRLAMELAVLHLPHLPDALLIDALRLPGCPLPQRAIVRGDSASLSIAAASVIAKTARDRLMTHFDRSYPAFRFGMHKGYGTALHAHAIAAHGTTPLHRRSFRPLWHISEKEQIDAA